MKFKDTDIISAYDQTSQNIQDVIWAPETSQLIDNVTSQNGLFQEEQKNAIADEVLYLLIGLTTKEEFPERINSLFQQAPEGFGEKIAKDITSALFDRKETRAIDSVSFRSEQQTQRAQAVPNINVRVDAEQPYKPPAEKTIQEKPVKDNRPANTNIHYGQQNQTSTQEAIPRANPNVREKLELRPENTTPRPEEESSTSKPLTREDVLDALASRRTMAGDIESLKNNKENTGE